MSDERLRALELEAERSGTSASRAALARAYARAGREEEAHGIACDLLEDDAAAHVRELVLPEPGAGDLRRSRWRPRPALRSRIIALPHEHDVPRDVVDLGGGVVAARCPDVVAVDVLTGELRWTARADELGCALAGRLVHHTRTKREAVLGAIEAASGQAAWETRRAPGGPSRVVPLDARHVAWSVGEELLLVDVSSGQVVCSTGTPGPGDLLRLPGQGLALVGRTALTCFDPELQARWTQPIGLASSWAGTDGVTLTLVGSSELLRLDLEVGAIVQRAAWPHELRPLVLAGDDLVCARAAPGTDDALVAVAIGDRAERWRASWPGPPSRAQRVVHAFDGRGALIVLVDRPDSAISLAVLVDPGSGAELARAPLAPAYLRSSYQSRTHGAFAAGHLVVPARIKPGRGRDAVAALVVLDAPDATATRRGRLPKLVSEAVRKATAGRERATALASPDTSGAELLRRLEAVAPALRRYEAVLVDSLRTAVAAGAVLDGQRAEALKILERVRADERA